VPPTSPARRQGPVRALIVDDSALMRTVLAEILSSTGEIAVVGTARDGEQAIEEARRLKPDVITLDVQMPGRSGVEILPDLLAAHEAPVVMVSALTQEGADVTLAALELGAVDYMPKPDRFQLSEMRQGGQQLVSKVLTAAQGRVRRVNRPAPTGVTARRPRPAPPADPGPADAVAVIGISTGGPQTLAAIVPLIEPPMPPILIVQHMPPRFTGVFAERLNRHAALSVKEAEEGDAVAPGRILIAPGGRHLLLSGRPPRVRVSLSEDPPVSGHRPSIDVLFQEAAQTYGARSAAFLMTGMGRDGVEGCRTILGAGGETFAQDETTSIVYGMNKAAITEGTARHVFKAEELPALLRGLVVTWKGKAP
jgi:two-component system chemotaxis response regulator CheB